MISVVLIIDTTSTERFRSDVRQQWQARIDDLGLQLQSRILQSIQTVWGLAANVSVNPDIGETRFRELASVIFRLAPELRNIGLAPNFIIRHIYPLEGNRAAIGLDLTSQKDRQMQQRFWGLFELAPIGIGLYSARRRTLLRANKSFERIIGTGAGSLDYFEVAYDQNGNRLPKGLGIEEKLNTAVQFSGQEGYLPGPEGELRPVVLHGLKLLDTDDHKPVIWLIAEDISEQKKVDRMKNEFISTVSHELRTPLTSICGSLGLLVHNAAGELPEKVSHLANIAYRNSKQLTFLINDLLDIEKLVAGKMVFQLEDHRVRDIVREQSPADDACRAIAFRPTFSGRLYQADFSISRTT